MSTPTLEFLFDFGSPNAYFCHKVLPAITQRTGQPITYVPILLGGIFKLANNRSPVEANADIPHKRAYEHLEIQRFIRKHDLHRYQRNPQISAEHFDRDDALSVNEALQWCRGGGCAPAAGAGRRSAVAPPPPAPPPETGGRRPGSG